MGDSKDRMRTTTRDHNSLTDFASNVERERLNGMNFSAADRLPLILATVTQLVNATS